MPQKNILILFPLEHIAFSPTTLGIYDALSEQANVTIYCPKTTAFKVDNLGNRQLVSFKMDTGKKRKLMALPQFFFNKLKNSVRISTALSKLKLYDFVRYLEYKKALNSIDISEYDEIIAVDILMLAIVTQKRIAATFLSLELNDDEIPLLREINAALIKAVVIQTETRYKHLFNNKKHTTFYIQNAPVYKEIIPREKIKNTIIFNGTATPWFGLYHALEFIKFYPDYSITFKGAISTQHKKEAGMNYNSLINNGKVIFNNEYVESSEMLAFLSEYEIGFCFYDLSFPRMNTFNYKTAPSGKMFSYLAAGVPVIGNDIEGLKVVEEFEAGVLIKDFKPETIMEAVNKIKKNYEFYRTNCLAAAKFYSFDKSVQPFKEYLK